MNPSPASPASAAPVDAWRPLLGPIGPLLEDPGVTEIMVNGPERIFVERRGMLERVPGARFESREALVRLMQTMAGAVGKTLDAKNPLVDARLSDGSRMNAVVEPVAVGGPALTIRKFSRDVLTVDDLVNAGTLDARLAAYLRSCVLARLNIVVCGGSGTGKTTLLNVLGSFVPATERVVTIEDTAELVLPAENVVRLESRPPTASDPGVSIRSLVVNALRMRPDRILVGECRGSEAFDMLLAMNTGHEGSMTTLHASGGRDALRRLESMVLMAGTEMPVAVVRQHVAGSVHVIVHVQRGQDGVRRVGEVLEVAGMEGDVILTQDAFRYDPQRGFVSAAISSQFVERFREVATTPRPGDGRASNDTARIVKPGGPRPR